MAVNLHPNSATALGNALSSYEKLCRKLQSTATPMAREASLKPPRLFLFWLVLITPLILADGVQGQDLSISHRLGSMQGFLTLRDQAGATLAAGDLTQVPNGDRVKLRVVFHFRDGSIDDETTIFSQQKAFRLISDRHIQKGPSFPHPCDITIDIRAQQVTIHDLSKANEAPHIEHMDLPPDLANGIIFFLIMDLPPDAQKIEFPYLSPSLKPRMVKLAVTAVGKEPFKLSGLRYHAVKYDLKVDIGGVAGVVAPVIGKQPPDSYVWVTEGTAPTIVRMDSFLYEEGPVWSIRLASPVW
jgi:hypothetical protein